MQRQWHYFYRTAQLIVAICEAIKDEVSRRRASRRPRVLGDSGVVVRLGCALLQIYVSYVWSSLRMCQYCKAIYNLFVTVNKQLFVLT